MLSLKRSLFVMLTLLATSAQGSQPHIGYLYPAGAQQGTVIKITAGGQFLRGAKKVHISGDGVTASVVQYARQPNNLNKEQRKLIEKRLKEVKSKRLHELSFTSSDKNLPNTENISDKPKTKKKSNKPKTSKKKGDAKTKEVKMLKLPILYDLDNKSIEELEHIKNIIFMPRWMKQDNRQISELVMLEITVEPDAMPGNREMRIETRDGLTNPIVFQVGTIAETRELEPNGQSIDIDHPKIRKSAARPKPNFVKLPVLLNGQIMPGDTDRFRFDAQKGQKLVIEAQARSLIPYLADAVPGWFQATLALYDDNGRELAFTDDYQFNPDPVLFYEVPADGEYELEVRDSIYRGREDFVYRISIGQMPFITQIFPLGGREGHKKNISIDGWNVLATTLPLDTRPGDKRIRETVWNEEKQFSNSVSYVVDSLLEFDEKESNNTIKTAQRIDMPKIVNGRIDFAGDVDVFKIKGKAGETIVAEVYARKLNSPVDSLLRLTDGSGKVLQWNDDYVLKDSHLYKDVVGLITHHADSYLMAKLEKNGNYYLHISDTQEHGGKGYGYRLRISKPIPDFALRVTPSSLSMQRGGIAPITVHALRKDGFDGEIEIVFQDAPPGFVIHGGVIPAGSDRARMTIGAPRKALAKPVALKLRGKARIGEKTITATAVPADDMMQAFLYRHLVPAKEFMVAIRKTKWPASEMRHIGGRIEIKQGQTAKVKIKTPNRNLVKDMVLVLKDPPDGLTLGDLTAVDGGFEFVLKTDEGLSMNGFKGNQIVEVFREYMPKHKKGKPAPKKSRYSIGYLPAIPIEIAE